MFKFDKNIQGFCQYTVESRDFEVLGLTGFIWNREVDIKLFNPKNDYYHEFSINLNFGVRKRNASKILLRTQTYVLMDSYYLKWIINRSYTLNPVCPKFISN